MANRRVSIQTDRELLFVLKTQLENLSNLIRGVSDRIDRIEHGEVSEDRIKNLEKYLYDLQTNKLDKAAFDKEDATDLEKRVRTLENFRWWIVGASSAAGLVGNIIGHLIFK